MERPILFSGPMVRAILEGRKTQTRRIIKPQDLMRLIDSHPHMWTGFMGWQPAEAILDNPSFGVKSNRCPYGQPGDRLWVRETLGNDGDGGWWYSADTQYISSSLGLDNYPSGWAARQASKASIQSIHMPRWASRILLEIVSERVERLNEISCADARAEGAVDDEWDEWREDVSNIAPPGSHIENERDAFSKIWEGINGTGSWEANPWVWVVEFKRVDGQ